jgi:hypothetical protein
MLEGVAEAFRWTQPGDFALLQRELESQTTKKGGTK